MRPPGTSSPPAHKARERNKKRGRNETKEPVQIEHVMRPRAYAQAIIELVDKGKSDDCLISYIKRTYRLVLLTKAERTKLDRINRSKITKDRIKDAGIKLLG